MTRLVASTAAWDIVHGYAPVGPLLPPPAPHRAHVVDRDLDSNGWHRLHPRSQSASSTMFLMCIVSVVAWVFSMVLR
jgi:hypothetical protein